MTNFRHLFLTFLKVFGGLLVGTLLLGAAGAHTAPSFANTQQAAMETLPAASTSPRLFTTGGHVVGFEDGGYLLATPDHLLRVRFAGAR
ncbi:MAG: hypothetical protein WCP34_05415, partial [Pseudomonadota bacterium]